MVALRTGPDLWLDVLAFRTLLADYRRHYHPNGQKVGTPCKPLLAEAAGLYRDDFLAGFTLPDSPAFDEWQFFQSESLRSDLAGALEQLVAYYHHFSDGWQVIVCQYFISCWDRGRMKLGRRFLPPDEALTLGVHIRLNDGNQRLVAGPGGDAG